MARYARCDVRWVAAVFGESDDTTVLLTLCTGSNLCRAHAGHVNLGFKDWVPSRVVSVWAS